jgi:hypothetical protein
MLEIHTNHHIQIIKDIIPSKLYLNKDFNTGKDKGGEGSTMEKLSKIMTCSLRFA